MNKQFPRVLATTEELEDKKSFSFGFSLDSLNGEAVKEAESENKKKGKSKPKKKKKAVEPDSETVTTAYDKPEGNISDAPPLMSAAGPLTDAKLSSIRLSDVITNGEMTSKTGTDILEGNVAGTVCEKKGVEEKTSKKKKKKKSKTGSVSIIEEDDDIDFLVREIQLLEASQAPPTPSISSPGPKSTNRNQSLNRSGTPNKKVDTTISFKSHKDPELSDEQRTLFRYGNGKNLVAIGPPKHKAREPIWKLSPPPGLKIPNHISAMDLDEVKSTSDKNVPPLQPLSHCSPFSFGFGF